MTRWLILVLSTLVACTCAVAPPATLLVGCDEQRTSQVPVPASAARSPDAGGGPCVSVDGMPDRRCTPGGWETSDPEVVCGQPTSVRRDVPASVRRKVLAAYGAPERAEEGAREVDHLIPLEVGGANAEENLFPQLAPFFHQKDRLENAAHRWACRGWPATPSAVVRARIRDAQIAFMTDWRTVAALVADDGGAP